MEGRALLQYLIDTSDVVLAKKQEATEYLANLEAESKMLDRIVELLVVSGNVKVEKVEQARKLALSFK